MSARTGPTSPSSHFVMARQALALASIQAEAEPGLAIPLRIVSAERPNQIRFRLAEITLDEAGKPTRQRPTPHSVVSTSRSASRRNVSAISCANLKLPRIRLPINKP
jgi:hypothetical protein